MPRKGKRHRLDTNIYQDGSGISVRVGRIERRYSLGTPLVLLRQVRAKLQQQHAKGKASGHATLYRDCVRYLQRKTHLTSQCSLGSELDAWCRLYGTRPRHSLTRDDVLTARSRWANDGLAPKTINHRVNRLRALFRELDGHDADSPTDGIRPLPVPRTPIQRIHPQTVLDVIDRMATAKYKTKLRKPIARLLVYATTGRRPSEIARAQPRDVDFTHRVWIPRDGKGGFTPGLYLNDDMLFAWQYFNEVGAWGRFNTRVFPRTLRRYGWPEGVRPYNLRHTIGITLSEGGTDLADVGAMLGHKKIETTRSHYVPVLHSRMQKMSEALHDRFALPVPRTRSTSGGESCRETPELQDRATRKRGINTGDNR